VRVGIPANYGRERGAVALDDRGSVQMLVEIKECLPWKPAVVANQR
jgi:hypothetical protein